MSARVGVFPLGDSAVIARFGDRIDRDVHKKVRALTRRLEQNPPPGAVEWVPAFASVTVFYDPLLVRPPRGVPPYRHMCRLVEELVKEAIRSAEGAMERPEGEDADGRLVEIPVCYGEEFGPDLEFVARHNSLTPEQVIDLHSGRDYRVYMIGFAPGFPYLGGMSERIAAPRKASPRLLVPAGSVGIAGAQTGIYPIAGPGGWQLIGRTPVALFRPAEHPPTLLRAGDRVRFVPISRSQYDRWTEGET